jgi:hypothetical protein
MKRITTNRLNKKDLQMPCATQVFKNREWLQCEGYPVFYKKNKFFVDGEYTIVYPLARTISTVENVLKDMDLSTVSIEDLTCGYQITSYTKDVFDLEEALLYNIFQCCETQGCWTESKKMYNQLVKKGWVFPDDFCETPHKHTLTNNTINRIIKRLYINLFWIFFDND